jgi:hypothetical protein
MRALILTALGIVLIIFSVSIYNWWERSSNLLAPIPPNYALIGVIDISNNHSITLDNIRSGDAILLVLDTQAFHSGFIPEHPELHAIYSQPFDLKNYDTNHDKQIDSEDPIWPYLYVISYSGNGATFQVQTLSKAGIRGIVPAHLSPTGNHEVILSDGNKRTLYETKRAGTA